MIGRLLLYFGLAVDAYLRGHFIIAALCAVIPFIGPLGMLWAVVAGVAFFWNGLWIEGLFAIGYLVLCLIGNRKRQSPELKSRVW